MDDEMYEAFVRRLKREFVLIKKSDNKKPVQKVTVFDVECDVITDQEELENLLNYISMYFDISYDSIMSKSRVGKIPFARGMYCYIAKEVSVFTNKTIGRRIKLPHDMVFYYHKKMKGVFETYQLDREVLVGFLKYLKIRNNESRKQSE